MTITIQSGVCPVIGKTVFALYDEDLPIVPATVYLRHLAENQHLAPNTILARAYALKSFFTFLERNHRDFWDLTPAVIKQFKRFNLTGMDDTGAFSLKRVSAQQYLNSVKGLIQYWRRGRDSDPFFADRASELDGTRKRRSRHGHLRHASWEARIEDDLWQVRVPSKERHDKPRYRGLSVKGCKAVMLALNRAPRGSDLQTMLYYRDRAIWTFLLMSGERKGELVRARLEDVNPAAGLVTIVDRPADAWLGDLKTGPGEIYVTTSNPYWRFLDSWLTEGRWIAEELLQARGEEDHGMLFCNRDGGSLTQAAVDHLFNRLREACGFDPRTPFHPHTTRHTIASLMIDSGVELTEVQKFLRHKSIQSTERYAQASDKKLRRSLEAFWGSIQIVR